MRFPQPCLIEIINGSLIIEDNSWLTMMSGFESLQQVGNLILRNNRNLVSLRGLDNLEFVQGDVVVMNNGESLSLSQLDSLVVTERREQGIDEASDDQLHFPRRKKDIYCKIFSQNCFDTKSWSQDLFVSTIFDEDTLTGLQYFHGLGSLSTIGGDLLVTGNAELIDFSGLTSLKLIGGHVSIKSNHKLETLNGFGALERIAGNFSLVWNSYLSAIAGVDSLVTIGGSFIIEDNEVLQDFGYMPSLININGDFVLKSNHHLLSVHSGQPLALAWVGGSIQIEDNRRFMSLQGLDYIETIDGDLVILRNPQLLSMSFTALTTVTGSMYAQGEFQNYRGMESLQTIGGSLWIHSLQLLTSLRGLESLLAVGGDFYVQLNPLLVSISELESLNRVGGRLIVYQNELLEIVDGMIGSLVSVGEYVQIDFKNGTIECPRGSGVLLGEIPLIYDTTDITVPANETTLFGNWCTLNCLYPMVTSTHMRMWQCQEEHFWNNSVFCVY